MLNLSSKRITKRMCLMQLAALAMLALMAVSYNSGPQVARPHGAKAAAFSYGNFEVIMGNRGQNSTPIDFKVSIDGHPVYTGEIESDPVRTTRLHFDLAAGTHSVSVKSDKVGIAASESVHVDDKVWVHIRYLHDQGLSSGTPIGPVFWIFSRYEAPLID